jgi:hypothetical protein
MLAPCGLGDCTVGKVKIPYYRVKGGNGFFEPTPKMRAAGFLPRPCGVDGPEAWQRAWALYEDWQRCRRGEMAPPERAYLIGSVGEAFDRYRRTDGWRERAPGTRREWEYAWGWIAPLFVDVDPNTIELEMIESLRATVRGQVSDHAAHKVIKVWRALWKAMASMHYCDPSADPSLGLRNKQPRGRSQTWAEGEVVRLVKQAWRMRFYGLAAILAVIWDTQFSPGDARTLTEGQRRRDRRGSYFETARAKTGRAAIGTLSPRTDRLIAEYRKAVKIEILTDTPLFRDQRGASYTMFSLARDFRLLRNGVLPGDTRRMMDMRRSGAVEAGAGEVDPIALANKMANSIDKSGELQETYLPRQVAVVRLADDARKRGRSRLRENR